MNNSLLLTPTDQPPRENPWGHNAPILNRVKLINVFSEILLFSKVKASRTKIYFLKHQSCLYKLSSFPAIAFELNG